MKMAGTKGSDPITREVVYRGLLTIADEMSEALGRSAYSPIIREMIDYSCAVFDPGGELVAQAENIPAHLGSMGHALSELLKDFPADVFRPGDVFMTNDPYRGGTHTPDVHIFIPAFFEEHLVGICGTIAHHTDMGGKYAGTEGFDNRSIFEEGIRFPPLKLAELGELNPAIVSIITGNVREPSATMGDLRAQIASCRHGERRLAEFCERFGPDTVLEVMKWSMDYSERRVRAELSRMTDGYASATGWLDDDGVGGKPVKLCANVAVSGDQITVDFEGTAEQMAGGMNVPPAAATSAVLYAVKCVVDPGMPQNQGCFRPIRVKLPVGKAINPEYPAAVSLRHLAVQRLGDTILRALAELYPDRVSAGAYVGFSSVAIESRHPRHGDVRVAQDDLGGGMGAHAGGDGIDAVDTHLGNVAILPAEICEQTFLLRIISTELIPDSGGPGKYRGGIGIRRIYEVLEFDQPSLVYTEQQNPEFAPWGRDGGHSGSPAKITLLTAGEDAQVLTKAHFIAAPGDRIVIETGGGGGFGDPGERDRELVARDLQEGKISPGAASDIFGYKSEAA